MAPSSRTSGSTFTKAPITSPARSASAARPSRVNRQTDGRPLVSVILTTRDRPRFLDIALACYAHQTYPDRELIVVDDGQEFPADPDRVAAAGGKLVRVPPGTPLGTKLNAGVREARGVLCQKMDDDDWYAANFMEKLAE